MRIVFIGTGEIGVPTLRALLEDPAHELVGVVTQPDKAAGRAQELRASPIKIALVQASIPLAQPKRIKAPEAISEIRSWRPDVIVVMAYGQILPHAVLEIPRFACLNLHASLLPRHRGAAPIQSAILAGDRETGITVMYMDEGLDTGDILLQSSLTILPNETGGELHDRLGLLAPDALAEALQLLKRNNAPRRPQNTAEATYAKKLERDDGEIDWSKPAQEIERTIRAFNPWPGAFTRLRAPSGLSRKLKVFRAEVVTQSGEPGKVLRTNDAIVVCSGRDSISLGEVQLEGKRRMSAAEFLRGFAGEIEVAR